MLKNKECAKRKIYIKKIKDLMKKKHLNASEINACLGAKYVKSLKYLKLSDKGIVPQIILLMELMTDEQIKEYLEFSKEIISYEPGTYTKKEFERAIKKSHENGSTVVKNKSYQLAVQHVLVDGISETKALKMLDDDERNPILFKSNIKMISTEINRERFAEHYKELFKEAVNSVGREGFTMLTLKKPEYIEDFIEKKGTPPPSIISASKAILILWKQPETQEKLKKMIMEIEFFHEYLRYLPELFSISLKQVKDLIIDVEREGNCLASGISRILTRKYKSEFVDLETVRLIVSITEGYISEGEKYFPHVAFHEVKKELKNFLTSIPLSEVVNIINPCANYNLVMVHEYRHGAKIEEFLNKYQNNKVAQGSLAFIMIRKMVAKVMKKATVIYPANANNK